MTAIMFCQSILCSLTGHLHVQPLFACISLTEIQCEAYHSDGVPFESHDANVWHPMSLQ